MKKLKNITSLLLLISCSILIAQSKQAVASFNKVIISPHIETVFEEGNEESVTILNSTEPESNINIEVNEKTLRVYLDDAKEITKQETKIINGYQRKVPIYIGKVLTIKVTYKNLNELSIRGEQKAFCTDLLKVENFKLTIYGESNVIFKHVAFNDFQCSIYGESLLMINNGNINNQKITAFGEGTIDLLQVANKTSKLTAYGEAKFRIQASEKIKFTAFGEASLKYKGEASIVKELNSGDSNVIELKKGI